MNLGDFFVTWKYDVRSDKWAKPKMGQEDPNLTPHFTDKCDGVTECLIRTKEGQAVARGLTFKSKEDCHDKKIARKYSLTRALNDLTSDMDSQSARELRKQIWAEYRNISKI